ncbi:MAG: 30S ribosomal protein S1 [Bacteroidetes bacterium]|nr:MAG: 30S ribosomal protein S1 [Bacteroidota bacterium]
MIFQITFAAFVKEDYHLTEQNNNLTEQPEVENTTAAVVEGAKETKKKKSSSASSQIEPPAFDWSMDDQGFGNYTENEKTELAKLYEGTLSEITENELVKGTVVSITDKDVVLNIGFKSDGLIPRTEFRDMPEMKIGSEVEVMIESKEDKNGQLVLSRKKAISERAWENIVEANENDTIVEGYVKSRTKGGLVVDVMGMDAFLPGSQIDIKPIRDYDVYVGQTMQFKVVKINQVFKNVVISHKALIEDDIEAQKSDILSKLEKGQVLEGVVKNMTSFGVFIDLGGLDGLLHITDISWGRINHPEEVLQLDQKINVVVLDFDDDKKRISLGLKQLQSHPWDSLPAGIEVGAKVKGKIVTVADYGAFLEIAPGVEGLIHVSEMSWSQHLRNPQDFMKVGDEIEAVILTLDADERKMSLGIKQLYPDPWVSIEEKYGVGTRHTGVVRNLTNYGLFVELEEGVDGLVHVSDLSWSKKIKHPSEFVKKDQELEVLVLEVDKENRRLSLGHKQLEENPWDTFEDLFPVDSEHEGTVLKIADKGATVALPYGVEGYAPTRQLKKEDGSNAKEDEVLAFRVIEFSKENRRITVSHTAVWKEDERVSAKEAKKDAKASASKAVKKMNQNVEKDTLGDLDALTALKAQMESAEQKTTAKKKAAPKKAAPKKAEETKAEDSAEETKTEE